MDTDADSFYLCPLAGLNEFVTPVKLVNDELRTTLPPAKKKYKALGGSQEKTPRVFRCARKDIGAWLQEVRVSKVVTSRYFVTSVLDQTKEATKFMCATLSDEQRKENFLSPEVRTQFNKDIFLLRRVAFPSGDEALLALKTIFNRAGTGISVLYSTKNDSNDYSTFYYMCYSHKLLIRHVRTTHQTNYLPPKVYFNAFFLTPEKRE